MTVEFLKITPNHNDSWGFQFKVSTILSVRRKIPSAKRAAKIAKQIGQPIAYWVELALQDNLKKCRLNLKVSVA